MPFPIERGETGAESAAKTALIRARTLRRDAEKYIAQCDASALSAQDLIVSFLYYELRLIKQELAVLVAVPGFFSALQQLRPATWATAA